MQVVFETELEVIAIGDDGWVARDPRLDQHDARAVLAYIERRSGGFEVLQLGRGATEMSRFDRWDEALDALRRQAA